MDKYMNHKKTVEHEDDSDTNCSWGSCNRSQEPGEETQLTEDKSVI